MTLSEAERKLHAAEAICSAAANVFHAGWLNRPEEGKEGKQR